MRTSRIIAPGLVVLLGGFFLEEPSSSRLNTEEHFSIEHVMLEDDNFVEDEVRESDAVIYANNSFNIDYYAWVGASPINGAYDVYFQAGNRLEGNVLYGGSPIYMYTNISSTWEVHNRDLGLMESVTMDDSENGYSGWRSFVFAVVSDIYTTSPYGPWWYMRYDMTTTHNFGAYPGYVLGQYSTYVSISF